MDDPRFELDNELLAAASKRAEENGETISDVLREVLIAYVETSHLPGGGRSVDGVVVAPVSSRLPDDLPDPSDEPTYVFVFRVFPEDGWGIDPVPVMQVERPEGRFTLICEFRSNRLFARVYGPDVGDAWLNIKNEVRRAAILITDALGFANAAAPTLLAESYKLPGGALEKFTAGFDGLYDHDGSFNDSLFMTLVVAAGDGSPKGQAVGEAIAEVRLAILEPEKSAVHSFRAVEAVRQTFVENSDLGRDRTMSWTKLRDAVSVPRSELDWLRDKSIPVRHGEIQPISFEERQRAISIARRVIRDYIGA